jgi:mannan endo-1,4-beta-mannosidase
MNVLNAMGAHLIRSQTLGVSVGNPLSVQPALHKFNEDAFDAIDWAVYQAREHGLRIMAPLTDNYDYYHGGKFDFLRFRGINVDTTKGFGHVDPLSNEFYTNRQVINDFKVYVKHLLTHKNKYTGLTYAEDPTIAMYETGNELGGPDFGDMNVPNSWTREISAYIKEIAPHKLVVDGTYGVNATHFSVSEIDIFSDHYYPLDVNKLNKDIALATTANRPYLVGEYDWTGLKGGDSLQTFYAVIEAQQKKKEPIVAGDLFWSLFEHNVPDCNQFVNHTDGFTLQYGNPANSAQANGQISQIRQHFFRMLGKTVIGTLPAVRCPGPNSRE